MHMPTRHTQRFHEHQHTVHLPGTSLIHRSAACCAQRPAGILCSIARGARADGQNTPEFDRIRGGTERNTLEITPMLAEPGPMSAPILPVS